MFLYLNLSVSTTSAESRVYTREGKIFSVLLAIVTTLIIIYFFIREKEKLKQGKRRKK